MLTSLFTGWFARTRAPFRVEVSQTADGTLVRVEGDPRGECAGALLVGLPAPAPRRPAVVTLDLSGLRSISPLAAGVLAGYRRSLARSGGGLRLAGVLQPAVEAALARADFFETGAEGGPCR